jgi:hypothetical protein
MNSKLLPLDLREGLVATGQMVLASRKRIDQLKASDIANCANKLTGHTHNAQPDAIDEPHAMSLNPGDADSSQNWATIH